jgi:hypothetical protein
MGAIKNRVTDIVSMICEGYDAREVATYFGETIETVERIAADYGIPLDGYPAEDYDDSMDGDFDSAMASAGFGTDEDYGYYGDE